MKKSIGSNFFFSLIKTLTRIIFPLITFPYASRVLGVDNIGKVQYCNSIISYFTLISGLGVSIYAIREGSKYKNDNDKLAKFSKEILAINTISTIISYGLFLIYLLFFFSESYYLLIVLCSLAIAFQTYSIEWLYQIKEDFAYISGRAFLMNVISVVLMFLFVKEKDDFVIYALINIIGSFGSFFFNIYNSKKYINIRDVKNIELKKHLKPIFLIFGVSIASSIYMNLDTVMLGAIIGTTSVGLYTVAVKLVSVVKQLMASFSSVLFPRLSNYLGNNKHDEYSKLLFKGIDFTLLLLVPCVIGMVLIGKELIFLLSGIEYIEATLAAQILAVNLFFSVIDGVLYYQVLLPFKEEKMASMSTWIGAIINIILNFLIIPKFSFTGAAFTTLISEICVSICILVSAKKHINIYKLIRSALKYIIYCIPMMLYCLIINKLISSYYMLIFVSVIGSMFIYLLTLIVFKDNIAQGLVLKGKHIIRKVNIK